MTSVKRYPCDNADKQIHLNYSKCVVLSLNSQTIRLEDIILNYYQSHTAQNKQGLEDQRFSWSASWISDWH